MSTTTELKPIPAPTAVPPMRMRNFRCDDETWADAMAQAKDDGIDLSFVIRHYLAGYGAAKRQARESKPASRKRKP